MKQNASHPINLYIAVNVVLNDLLKTGDKQYWATNTGNLWGGVCIANFFPRLMRGMDMVGSRIILNQILHYYSSPISNTING